MATVDTINNTTSTNSTNSTNSASVNSNSVLDKDAFLKLLLIEMQNQDPTDPMDTDKMLTQTSQLAALEMQQNTNETMQKMVETMELLSAAMLSNNNMAIVNAIGKMATITDTTFTLNQGQSISVRMYLPKATGDGGATFQVMDKDGNVIRDIKVEKDQLNQGVNIIGWDGRDNDGVFVGSSGNYTMRVSYLDVDGGTSTSSYGSYPIESIKFENGVGKLIIGGKEVTFDQISQIS